MPDINRPGPACYADAGIIVPRKINLAILTYNALASTKLCLASLIKNTPHEFNIFVLDNMSSDGTRAWLSEQRVPNLIYELGEENLGVPNGRNRLLRMIDPYLPSDGFVVFADNDMEFLPGWAEVYLSFFEEHPQAGIASAQGASIIVHQERRNLLAIPKHTAPVDVGCGGFACWIRAATRAAVGDFDRNLGIFWHEDDDYSLRAIAAGWEVYVLPHAPVVHHEHKSGVANPGLQKDGSPENQKYLCAKWRSMGIVDSHGRIIHKHSPIPVDQERQIARGVMARGIDPDCGGYRKLLKRASISVSQQEALASNTLQFRLRCYEEKTYENFPLKVQVSQAGEIIQELLFVASNQELQVSLPLSWSSGECKSECKFEIEFSASFVPALADLDQWDCRALGGYVSQIELVQSEINTTDHSSHKQHKQDTPRIEEQEGILLLAPTLSFGDQGLFSRELARSIKAAGIPLQVKSDRIDQNYNLILYSDRQGWLEQHGHFSTRVDTGTLICVLPQLRAQRLPIFSTLREQYPSFKRFIGVIENDADLPFVALLREASCLDEVWFLSEFTRKSFLTAGLAAGKAKLMPMPPIAGFQLDRAARKDRDYCFGCFISADGRSAWELVVKAFLTTFKAEERVRLCLKHDFLDPQPVKDLLMRILQITGEDQSRIRQLESIPASMSDPDYYRFLERLDCLVNVQRYDPLPYRTWQALANGKSAIISRVGPLSDLVSYPNAFPVIDQTKIPVGRDRRELRELFPETAAWYQPSLPELMSQMRNAFVADESGSFTTLNNRDAKEFEPQRSEFTTWIQQQMETKPAIIKTDTFVQERVEELALGAVMQPQPSQVQIVRPITPFTVGIDARTLTLPETAQRGIGHYTVNHLSKIIELTPDWQYFLFLEAEGQDEHLQVLQRFNNVKATYFDTPYPKLDLYHIPDQMSLIAGFDSPMRLAPACPTSVVFYDLIPLTVRQNHFDVWDKSRQLIYLKRLEQIKQRNALVLAISEFTRRDLIQGIGISADQVVTIMAGPNKSVSAEPLTTDQAPNLLKRLGIAKPYFLSVGGLDPHKDFMTTALAFIAGSAFKEMELVVVGSNNDPYKEAFKELFGKHPCGKVTFTGYLGDSELKALYSMATALIFPSLYEGFGLPVLEAMANGCPVICSNTTSIPEVAGDAALYITPGDVEGMAQRMLALLENSALADDLSRRGKIQADKFSWDRVAQRTLAAWQNFLNPQKIVGCSPIGYSTTSI